MSAPDWVGDYIGMPWVNGGRDRGGLDCWGLVWLVFKERFGIEMPRFDDMDFGDHAKNTAAADSYERNAEWFVDVERGQERLGDLVMMRRFGLPIHIGIVVDRNKVLHSEFKKNACVSEMDSPHMLRRITSIRRHKALLGPER